MGVGEEQSAICERCYSRKDVALVGIGLDREEIYICSQCEYNIWVEDMDEAIYILSRSASTCAQSGGLRLIAKEAVVMLSGIRDRITREHEEEQIDRDPTEGSSDFPLA
jgi:hypothetical protein